MISAILLSGVLAAATVYAHVAGLTFLGALPPAEGAKRPHILALILLGLISLHVVEALIYALGYLAGTGWFGLGSFDQMSTMSFRNVLYYSLVTYSSLGLGDAYPNGHLKFLTGVQAVNGFLLISCSASFLFLSMNRLWTNGKKEA